MTARGGEVARKLIHVGVSLVAAGVVWRLAYPADAVVLAAAAAVALLIELARQASARAGAAFERAVGPMLRARERRRITGATSLAIGYAIAAAALPGMPALGGILFVGIGDAAAAIVGRRWGRRRFAGGKSLEGSATLFVCALAIAIAIPGVGPAAALAVAAAVTAVEAFTLPLDDNLYLPAAGAAILGVALALGGTQIYA